MKKIPLETVLAMCDEVMQSGRYPTAKGEG